MALNHQPFAEIETCKYLFLRDMTEQDYNGLRLLIEEGSASPESSPIEIAGVQLTGSHRVESSRHSRLFEITWDSYVAYSVRNESYVTRDDSEQVVAGKRIPVYSKSHFLDYVSHATFAQEEYPGPLHHFGVICESHIIDVVSTVAPRIRRIRPK